MLTVDMPRYATCVKGVAPDPGGGGEHYITDTPQASPSLPKKALKTTFPLLEGNF